MCEKTFWAKKNIFRNLYAIKSYISAHHGGYNLAYDHMRKYAGGIFSRVGIFLTVTPVTLKVTLSITIKMSFTY